MRVCVGAVCDVACARSEIGCSIISNFLESAPLWRQRLQARQRLCNARHGCNRQRPQAQPCLTVSVDVLSTRGARAYDERTPRNSQVSRM